MSQTKTMTVRISEYVRELIRKDQDRLQLRGLLVAGVATAPSAPQAELSEGEITRWDPRTLRLTLKHGEIKNLEMPPMTMVFRVADASVVGDMKPGDKVRFRAEQVNGAYHVKQIEKAP